MRHTLTTLVAAFVFPTAALAGDLTVRIDGVHSDQGSILAAVYDSEASYMKQPAARATFKVKASRGTVQYVLHDLPPGKYAVSVFHDENGNGKLDRNLLGIPKEGYGFSNGLPGSGRPPAFSSAAFEFAGTTQSITISLHY